MKDKKSDIINDENTSQDQLSAWARWQLPNMDTDAPVKENAYNLTRAPSHSGLLSHPEPEPEIKPPTLEEIEAIRQTAFEEGKEEGRAAGRAEGYNEGYKRGESDVKSAVTRLGQIARVLLEPIPNHDEELESAILQLVENICKRVVQRELKIDASGLQKVVVAALESLNPGAQRIRIHLNPADCELITEHLRTLGELEDNWRVLPHPTISPGGCIIETDKSLIDARAEKRLTAMIQQVFDQHAQALELASAHQGGMVQMLDEVDAFPADEPLEPGAEEGEDDSFNAP